MVMIMMLILLGAELLASGLQAQVKHDDNDVDVDIDDDDKYDDVDCNDDGENGWVFFLANGSLKISATLSIITIFMFTISNLTRLKRHARALSLYTVVNSLLWKRGADDDDVDPHPDISISNYHIFLG